MLTKMMKIKNNLKSGIKVGDIMTRNLVAVKPTTSLQECTKVMIKNKTGSVIVKDGQKLTGIIAERDIIWAMMKKGAENLKNIKAEDIAIKKVATIKPSADMYEALQRMKSLKFKRLPVVVEGNVIGMITWKDILKMEPALFEDINNVMRIKEESEKFKRMKGERWVKESLCEECGNFDLLYKVDNRLLCSPCKELL